MNTYMGCKLIQAEVMNLGDYNKYRGWNIPENEDPNRAGYLVKYPDGYESWSPKEIFEDAYMQVEENKELSLKATITKEIAEGFIKAYQISTIGDKTTLVKAILKNGYEIIETSSAADKFAYSEIVGAEMCKEKIINKVWDLLSFTLQYAARGLNYVKFSS